MLLGYSVGQWIVSPVSREDKRNRRKRLTVNMNKYYFSVLRIMYFSVFISCLSQFLNDCVIYI